MKSHPQQFSPVIGDELSDGSIFADGDADEIMKMPALTSSYLSQLQHSRSWNPSCYQSCKLYPQKWIRTSINDEREVQYSLHSFAPKRREQ